MFRPNLTGKLYRKGTRNVFGKVTLLPPIDIELAVVTLGEKVEDSSVRADSSASRGSADVITLQAKLLLPKNTAVAEGDVIEVLDEMVEVSGVKKRTNILGEIDHLEIEGNIKGDM